MPPGRRHPCCCRSTRCGRRPGRLIRPRAAGSASRAEPPAHHPAPPWARPPIANRGSESILSVEEELAKGGFTTGSMRQMLFTNRSRVAELAAADTARMCAAFPGGMAPSAGGPVDVTPACAALSTWDHTYSLDSRGSLLFERFIMRLVPSAPVPASLPWKVPFDPRNPLTTPNTLDIDRANVQQAFGDAAAELRAANIPLDARLGDHQTVTRGGQRIPLPGGSWQMGILNVIHPVWHPLAGNVEVATGTTYLQVVGFGGSACPNVTTLLASSQSADPTSPYHADQTAMFSTGQWVPSRFCEESILASPALRVVRLTKK
ncbi:penicillin acylase family protein [Micromonospora yasonensis]|uniref:penicillin acylase family protein n=1 Tax=Micromonospora yasonensis TaxID=1128667 RepID=UPI00222EC46D|nr:penicillin acylase family protein [Micromonospora yasonensis]MCW3841281.1 penicillin acylase family protein [Micromonospora yasonensis]